MQSHIELTVGGVTYKLVVDSWGKVDVIDFAPRAIAGTPAFSEMGLYLDVSQESFGHGFGRWRFGEPESYAYTGHLVDTSHGFISLFSYPTQLATFANDHVKKLIAHRGVTLFITAGILHLVLTTGAVAAVVGSLVSCQDLITNGNYFFIARSTARMLVGDLGDVGSAAPTTLTALVNPAWTTDIFATGTVVIYQGTGDGQSRTVSSNSADTLTVSSSWTTQPDVTSKFLVFVNAGAAGNPPNNFYRLATFGGRMWASEYNLPYVHKWTQLDGSDAEGGAATDLNAIRVGPGNILINNLITFNNQMWVLREDGGWVIGDDDVAYHTLNFGDQAHSDNFKVATVWNGFLYFSIRNTLYKYKSGLLDITPPRWNDDVPYKEFGGWMGLAPRGKFLYALGLSNTTNADEATETSAFGSIMRTDGVGWHKVMDVPQFAPLQGGMWLDPILDRMYFAARISSTGYLWYFPLQQYSDLPYVAFPTSGSHNLYTSYYDLGLRRISKSFANVMLDGDFPSGASVIVSYRLDSTLSWTVLGTLTAPMTALPFAASTEGKRVQLRLNLQSTGSGISPYIKTIIMKLMMRPKVLYGVNADVIVQSGLSGPDHSLLGHDASEIRAGLLAARDSVSPITLKDIYGGSASVYLSSLRFQMVEYEDTEEVAEIARCTFVYVNQST